MLKIRVKRITDNEVEITVLPNAPDRVLPLPPAAEPTETAPETAPSQERLAAAKLTSFLSENGTFASSGCRDLLKAEGFDVEGMNFSRVMKYADIHHYQEGGRSWWFLAAPVRAAAAELKKYLSDNGDRVASECMEHLSTELGFTADKRKQWFLRNYAGVEVVIRDGDIWWSLSDDGTVEIAESFDGFSFDDLELIEETTWQTS